ncbi:MAG: hypothetical protein M1837_007528 [Sclerophora amabilis]|nr:MAG: hypothetical protein M1837_007528 [Sclerophora amabilis]
MSAEKVPFTIRYPQVATPKQDKRRRSSIGPASASPEPSPFASDLAIAYKVRPLESWEALKKYRHFVVGSETFGLNDFVFVNNSGIAHGTDLSTLVEQRRFWIANVQEIRARDNSHVYLRVLWAYWPDELPGGAEDYHGKLELVPSNHMEIIDAMSVAGKADVLHWTEDDEVDELEGLYWRQTYSFVTQKLSPLRKHCTCRHFYNPDKKLLGCSNPKCQIWLHEECLVEDALANTYDRIYNAIPNGKPNMKPKGKRETENGASGGIAQRPWVGLFEAQIKHDRDDPIVVITDLRNPQVVAHNKPGSKNNSTTWEETVVCLKCREKIS